MPLLESARMLEASGEGGKMNATMPIEGTVDNSLLSRTAQRCCAWSERWFPDAFAFAMLAVALVASPRSYRGRALVVAENFGSGFWGLIPFTMQMSSSSSAATSSPIRRRSRGWC